MGDLDRSPSPAVRPFRFRLQWAAAAAVLLVLVTAYWFFGRTVSAAELLHKAADRESKAERQPRRPIRVATRSGSLVRPALWRPSGDPGISTADRVQAQSLQVLFEAANYSWEDPLSARSFSAWRASLRDRQDRVVRRHGDNGTSSYEISTRTASGALAEVRLALRVSDLHAVYGALIFRSHGLVEISEIPEEPPVSLTPPAPVSEPAAPLRRAAPREEPVTPGEELQVLTALRRIDADLGEPIEVERDAAANAILVTALGLSPDRRQVLEDALSGLSRVQLRFREPQQVREPSRRLASGAEDQTPPLQLHLESRFGSRSAAEEFTDRILQASESSLLRAHALRGLAGRFPPEIEARLTPQARALLDSLLSEHFAGLEAASRRVLSEGRLIGAAGTEVLEVQPQSWQAHCRGLVVSIERVDEILTKLLAIGGDPNTQQRLTLDLGRALDRMEAEIAAAEPAFRRKR
jgi:hypothetical protein